MARGPLALTLGEPAGIGPDIALAAWQRRAALDLPPFYLLADPQYLTRRAAILGLDVPIEVATPATAATVFARAVPVVELGLSATAPPGKPDDTSAPAAIASIDRAVEHVIAGAAAAIVTNPVAKSVLYESGFDDPGHTEYLAKLSFERTGNPAWPVMMLWAPEVAVVPVTIHVPLQGGAGAADARSDRRDRTDGGARSGRAFRHRPPAARGRRPQSACRRGGDARQGGRRDHRACDRAIGRRRHRRPRAVRRRCHVP